MAKNIRWQIPFVSLSGVHYRIDIYDEGTFTPVTLTGGTSPFVTSEDDSDDYFAPIRTQTGTIEVCTLMPDGNYITLDDLLPANNIARPVRLINRDNSDAIEWQGFLSCEAYDQDYTSIPQIIQLPVIGVLEAMDSVDADMERMSGLKSVGSTINDILETLIDNTDVSYFTRYYIPSLNCGRNILSKLIDNTIFFKDKEYNNENGTTYVIDGISLKECLVRIATYMGWCVRENNTSLFFMSANESSQYWGFYRQGEITPGGQVVIHWMMDMLGTNVATGDIADFKWMGINHQRSTLQGAKSVEVVAKVETNDFRLGLPDFPFGDTTTLEWLTIKYKSNTRKYLYDFFNNNNNAYNNIAYGYYSGQLTRSGDSQYSFTYLGESTKSAFFSRMSLLPQIPQPAIDKNPMVAGAIFMRYAIEDEQTSTHNMQTGLYCPLLPGGHGQDAPIFKMWTPKRSAFLNGHFNIKADMLFNALYRYNSVNEQIMSDSIGDSYINCDNEKLDMVFKVGTKYWTGSEWSDTRTIFQATMTDGGIDIEIPVEEYISGQVQIEVLAGVTITHVNTLYEVIFKSLEVSFAYNEDYRSSDRNENHYFRVLGTDFRDEISVNADLASNLNNQLSPSIIMKDSATPMTELNYGTNQVPDMRRPEVDLLNRLAAYYGAARQRLSLIVAHPTAAPLPLLRLNGISPDTRKYLPLAESRDWINDTSTLTCFETPGA